MSSYDAILHKCLNGLIKLRPDFGYSFIGGDPIYSVRIYNEKGAAIYLFEVNKNDTLAYFESLINRQLYNFLKNNPPKEPPVSTYTKESIATYLRNPCFGIF